MCVCVCVTWCVCAKHSNAKEEHIKQQETFESSTSFFARMFKFKWRVYTFERFQSAALFHLIHFAYQRVRVQPVAGEKPMLCSDSVGNYLHHNTGDAAQSLLICMRRYFTSTEWHTVQERQEREMLNVKTGCFRVWTHSQEAHCKCPDPVSPRTLF